MNNSPLSLEQMVNVIEHSKVFKNPLEIKQKFNISLLKIHYILQNEKEIIEQWKHKTDELRAIDALLLAWVARCKKNNIKLSLLTIYKQSKHLTVLLGVTSYHIQDKIWSEIKSILNGDLSDKETSKNINLDLNTILASEGKRLLKPQIYKKFLSIIKKRNFEHKNNHTSETMENQEAPKSTESNEDVILIEKPIKCIDITNEATEDCNNIVNIKTEPLSPPKSVFQEAKNDMDFPVLKTIKLEFKQQNTNEPKIKKEPCQYIGDETNIRPVVIKKEICNDYLKCGQNEFKEFLDISEDSPEIKQEMEFMPNDENEYIEIYKIVDSEQEDDDNEHPDNEKNANNLNEIEKNGVKIDLNNYSCPQNKLETNFDKENNSTANNTAAVEEDEDSEEIELVYEIEESDEDVQKELIEIINKYKNTQSGICAHENPSRIKQEIKQEPLEKVSKKAAVEEEVNENPFRSKQKIKQEPLEIFAEEALTEKEVNENPFRIKQTIKQEPLVKVADEASAEEEEEEEVITILEIISDDETDDGEKQAKKSVVVKPNKVYENSKSLRKNEHNNKSNATDNIPSTSRSSETPTPNKKPRLSFNTSAELKTSSIKSNEEAFKCVDHVKEYFQIQKDEAAVKLLHQLQKCIRDND